MFTFFFWAYLLRPDNKDDHANLIAFGLFMDAIAAILTVGAVLILKHTAV